MSTLQLIAIGDETGIVLPPDLLSCLGVKQGDALSVLKIPGGIELRLVDEKFEQQMEVARGVMRKNREALRELAKY